MKPASDALEALLNSRSFWSCDLFAITLVDGSVWRYAAADCDVKDVDGSVYSCGGMTGPYFQLAGSKGTIQQKLGVQADTMTCDLLPGKGLIAGIGIDQAVLQGLFAGATVRMLSAYAPVNPTALCWPLPITGTLTEFIGFVAEIDGGESLYTFTVNDVRERLNSKWPRNFYSPCCVEFVGSPGCGISLAAFAVTGSVTGGDAGTITTSLTQATGTFDLGVVAFTSGVNAGHSRSVRSWVHGTPGTMTLTNPFPVAPASGDAFSVTPGCDGSTGPQGCPKFGTGVELRYRGFPFVPAPTTAN